MILRLIPRVLVALALALASAPLAFAVDKEHRQMMADIRMLQEQNQQLHNLLGQIADALKAVNARIDEQTNVHRKALADQKLVIDNLGSDVRVIREKLDDNNVRLGSLSQEVDALRQGVQQLGSRPAPGDATPEAPAAADAAPPVLPPVPGLPVGTSPQRLWDAAYSDYGLGQYDLAISGFESFIKFFPRDDRADDAQVYIGNAHLQAGRNDKAVEAFDLAIRTYPGGNAIPDAYYRKGLALQNLKQLESAREAFETVIRNYPQSAAAILAGQRVPQVTR